MFCNVWVYMVCCVYAMHEQSMNHISLKKRPKCYVKSHTAGRVSANTRPHQLRYACSCVVRVLCLANLIPRLLDSKYTKLERSPGTNVVYIDCVRVDLFLCGSISM